MCNKVLWNMNLKTIPLSSNSTTRMYNAIFSKNCNISLRSTRGI